MKVLLSNRKAYFNFEILDKFEAGIELYGWEVKSLKATNANIANAYIRENNREIFLMQARIGLLKGSFISDKKLEFRDRKLLLHANEIRAIISKSKMPGNTAVPLEIYINDRGLIKIQIAIVKGKKLYEKKQKIKERDMKRSLEIDRKIYKI